MFHEGKEAWELICIDGLNFYGCQPNQFWLRQMLWCRFVVPKVFGSYIIIVLIKEQR